MAIHRGIQSALFWYLSCAPCVEAKYRKKRREEAERGRRDRELLAIEIPNMYRHPSPASTNPHWQTEIVAGPALVSRGKKKQKNSTNSQRGVRRSGTVNSNNGSNKPSSLDVSSTSGSRDGRNDSKFDFKQYQREDDVLWGEPSRERSGSAASWNSSSITRPPKAYARGLDTTSTHAGYRNPQINDLHPATVTKLTSRDEARWMFQPNPPADVMSGKSRATPRSRSDSGGSSRLSARSAVPLSREVSHRIVEQKLKNGVDPISTTEDRDFAQLAAVTSPTPEIDLSRPKANSVASPLQEQVRNAVSEDSNESSSTVIHRPDLAPEPLRKEQTRKVASRPQLSTIFSDSVAPSDEENSAPSTHPSESSLKGRDRMSRHSAFLAGHDESLKVIRDLAPQSRIFKTQLVSTDDLRRSNKKSSSRLPSQDTTERFDFDPDLFESWVHEHTKREVKERWSMDF